MALREEQFHAADDPVNTRLISRPGGATRGGRREEGCQGVGGRRTVPVRESGKVLRRK